MFLHLLTPDQQTTFFRAAGLVIQSDGAIAQAEVDLLEAAQLEASVDELPPAASSAEELRDDLGLMRGTPSANAFLFELAGLAAVDGAERKERAVLAEVGQDLGIAAQDVERFIDLAERTVADQREASELIAGAVS
jgi:hypothetical protein